MRRIFGDRNRNELWAHHFRDLENGWCPDWVTQHHCHGKSLVGLRTYPATECRYSYNEVLNALQSRLARNLTYRCVGKIRSSGRVDSPERSFAAFYACEPRIRRTAVINIFLWCLGMCFDRSWWLCVLCRMNTRPQMGIEELIGGQMLL